jgi:hypothetical protein
MTAKKTKTKRLTKVGHPRLAHEVEGAVSGALAGATFGGIAGPPGAVAGAMIGGAAGAIIGAVLDTEDSRKADHTRTLDAEIGASGGEMGAANLEHPPATVGAYSGASTGASAPSSSEAPAEGPMQSPDK